MVLLRILYGGGRPYDSDTPYAFNLLRRRHMRLRLLSALFAVLFLASGCVEHLVPAGPTVGAPHEAEGAFIMADGTRLPYRSWLPDGEPWAVVLALHGMNDSRDAWEYPAPDLAAHGVAVFGPDQRGFGDTADRGYWPGTQALVDDARAMALLLHRRYPQSRLFLLGESMGAAVLMCLATTPDPPPADGYVLVAPAVWGRAEMNVFLRTALWLFANIVPGFKVSGAVAKKVASDNREAIRRLSQDPLTIHETRADTVRGLVDLMDAALAAAPRFHAPALFLYGGKDELIPDEATAATWRGLPPGPVRAFYPGGYHLLLRDHERMTPIDDILYWMRHEGAVLPSGGDRAAAAWLAEQK
ncbi:MAG TPA: alpha/beta fold hydrolase [Acetobacteraceae bacterium]|nr:alpha/beta fold hydrolase [Acetobacteraceae bacterium]